MQIQISENILSKPNLNIEKYNLNIWCFEPKQLMNTEFNSLHRDGITGLFQRNDILKLREIIDGINGKAKI